MKCQTLILEDGEYKPCDWRLASHLKFLPPGPIGSRVLPVYLAGAKPYTQPSWEWNGSTDAPTLRPSVLSRTYVGDRVKHFCHSWVTGGRVEFLPDSNHSLSCQTHDLLDL
jgi:Family of unknown function (DUF6527)